MTINNLYFPGGSLPATSWVPITFNQKDGKILSVGWQNDGNAVNVHASQMFIYNNAHTAYLQLCNTSASSIGFAITMIWATSDDVVAAVEPEITVGEPVAM